MIISNNEGEILVQATRRIVTEYLRDNNLINLGQEFKDKFSFKSGVFVTLNKEDKLRGCIGYATTDDFLYKSLISASIYAATKDPRFPPVKYNELNHITFEVTILTSPVQIKVKDNLEYLKMIKIGEDGLIVKCKYGIGLLLPQVPIEYGWNEEEFLKHTCQKAGAPQDEWMQKDVIISKFQGITFKEEKPNGPVHRKL